MSNMPLIGKSASLTFRTPEGVSISYLLAGPVSRFLALSIDLICIAGFTIILNMAFGALRIVTPDIAGALLMIGYFLISIGYGIALEWLWRGQTIGKRILRLRVMDMQGLRLEPSQIVIRNLLRFLDSLPMLYLVGGVSCLISRNCQRLGDLAANTVVVRMPHMSEPDLDRIIPGKFNSLRQYPHLVTRLRQKASPAEASIVLRSLMRREELYPDARVELFGMIAEHFRPIVQFPEEATRGLSDEQYVTNIADVLFRGGTAPYNEIQSPFLDHAFPADDDEK